jgi:asparagine synthase (glutamine-hydrolysing)
MGYLVAAINKKGQDASDTIIKMLKATSRKDGVGYGIASHDEVELFRSLPDFTNIVSNRLIGYKSNTLKFNYPQPIQQGSQSIILEGKIWDVYEPDLIYVANTLESDPKKGIKKIISEQIGNYVIISLTAKLLLCGRDQVGATPLYLGEDKETIAISSNKKVLWDLGFTIEQIIPGTLVQNKNNKVTKSKVNIIKNPGKIVNSDLEIIKTLDRLIFNSVEIMSRDINEAVLAFSGGIDSSLLAYYLRESGKDILLNCVGVGKTSEFDHAKHSAEVLNLPLTLDSFTEEQVVETIDHLLYSIEEAHPMKIGVAMPLYWVAKNASQKGYQVIYSGNGSDELFGGYKKYLIEYQTSGDTVQKTMFTDVTTSWTKNLERDTKTCNDLGTQLRLPFTELNLIKYGLSIPIDQKLPQDNGIRKLIIRKLAKNIGLPDKIADRPKKAAQYSTRVNKIMNKIAKRHGVSIQTYLDRRFSNIFKIEINN